MAVGTSDFVQIFLSAQHCMCYSAYDSNGTTDLFCLMVCTAGGTGGSVIVCFRLTIGNTEFHHGKCARAFFSINGTIKTALLDKFSKQGLFGIFFDIKDLCCEYGNGYCKYEQKQKILLQE